MVPQPNDEARSLSSLQRALLILAALGVLLVTFVIARGGEDEPDRAASPAPSTQAPAPTEPAPATTEPAPADPDPDPEPEPEPEPAERTIRIVAGQPRGGPRTLTFVKGEPIALKVVSDVAEEIHVHGYDLSKDVKPGASVRFAFEATIEGRFEIELENTGTLLATLEVTPR